MNLVMFGVLHVFGNVWSATCISVTFETIFNSVSFTIVSTALSLL